MQEALSQIQVADQNLAAILPCTTLHQKACMTQSSLRAICGDAEKAMPDNALRKYLLTRRTGNRTVAKGDRPQVSDLVRFGSFALKGTRLGCGDPSQLPLGVYVDCAPGTYELEAECFVYAGDARLARASVMRADSRGARGRHLGRVGVDLAMACFFDADRLDDFANGQPDEYDEWIEDQVVMCDWVESGTLDCRPAKTKIPYFEVGFGDGEYDVFELRDAEVTVGLELVCLEADAPYPFDVIPVNAEGRAEVVTEDELPDFHRLVESLRQATANFTGAESIDDIATVAKKAVADAFDTAKKK
jgi:hypothetical protein